MGIVLDTNKYLIILKGKDKTKDIHWLEYDGARCKVTYKGSEKQYYYAKKDVQWLKAKNQLDIRGYIVYVDGVPDYSVVDVIDFGEYYRLLRENGTDASYRYEQITFYQNSPQNNTSQKIYNYFKNTAEAISLKVENNFNILAEQYKNIQGINEDSVLGSYLGSSHQVKSQPLPTNIIYPFGLNQSQKKAVENALSAQVSIIQGPPGTGKTQTILNIIANILLQGKTVAVVSNNNSATQNVVDKLAKYDLDFLTAYLGSSENKEKFLNEQKSYPSDIANWCLALQRKNDSANAVQYLTIEINEKLQAQNRLANIKQELTELETEYTYFQTGHLLADTKTADAVQSFSAKKVLSLLIECEDRAANNKKYGLIDKIKTYFKYNFQVVKLLNTSLAEIVPYLQQEFYKKKIQELQTEKQLLEKQLTAYNFTDNFNKLTALSMNLFKDALGRKYGPLTNERKTFSATDLIYDSENFSQEYPVILSTTYSIKKTLNSNFMYDYLIVDEASQVDLATGVLAMSCAKNIVIVGDLKQLPNVLTQEEIAKADSLWSEDIGEAYRYATQSLLSSACQIWQNAPTVLLKEHYRCAPKIINFCNQKFYNHELVVMTKEDACLKPLALYKTPIGNHERNKMNQREIDVIKNEVLPKLQAEGVKNSEIGIITPYRNQVQALKEQLPADCEIDTVHKFQGREKEVIILSSVNNDTSCEFVDDPHLLNVAVSRAVKSLIVVTSGNKENEHTNYGTLAKYIAYNNFEIVESKTHSVFDFLYKQYFTERMEYLKKHKRISEYDSENLMYSLIEEVLHQEEFSKYDCACHVSLVNIIKDYSNFTQEELKYAQNPLTHTDFLIYDKITKEPALAIEVDGVSFHKEGTRQHERDLMKNHIFAVIDIPLLRLSTMGSNEKDKISEKLLAIEK